MTCAKTVPPRRLRRSPSQRASPPRSPLPLRLLPRITQWTVRSLQPSSRASCRASAILSLALIHLAFLLAMGIAAACLGARPAVILSFMAASWLVQPVNADAVTMPLVEPLIALSLLAAGVLILQAGRRIVAALPVWLALATAAGLLHGYALRVFIVGAPAAALTGYLVGLAAMGTALPLAVMLGTGHLARRHGALSALKAAGAALGSLGVAPLARRRRRRLDRQNGERKRGPT